MSKGSGLFGWCLPGMGEEEHASCKGEFKFVNPVVCPCKCHGIREELIDEATTSSRSDSERFEIEQEFDSAEVI